MVKKSDVTKHTLVPKHSKLSDKEKKEILEKYLISFQELPKILKNDPALKNTSVKAGDIVRIERDDVIAGQNSYFRGVINA
jgi:DNA-directed RNA polymerase subunit H (RpoH/RPB5)